MRVAALVGATGNNKNSPGAAAWPPRAGIRKAICLLIAAAAIHGVFLVGSSSPTPSSVVAKEDPVAPFRGLPVPYLANGSQSILQHLYECDPLVTAPWMSKHDDPGIQKVLPADKLFGKKILFLGNSHTRQLYLAFVSTFSSFVTNITRNGMEVPFRYQIQKGVPHLFNVSFAFRSEAVIVDNNPLFYQPNVSRLEEFIGRPFAEFDVIVLGYVNPNSHCYKKYKDCPKDIQTNFSGMASRFRTDADVLLVNMFGRGDTIHNYFAPTSPNPNASSYKSFRDRVHRNHSFVDISRVPFCLHKSCADRDGHQCNNPGPPNLAAWHLLDCMKPTSSNATNCQHVEHSGG